MTDADRQRDRRAPEDPAPDEPAPDEPAPDEPAPDEGELDDPGGALYEERTDLAWSRSGLALVGVIALLARRVLTSGANTGDVLVVALLGISGLGWAIGLLGWQRWHRTRSVTRPREPRELFAVAAGTVALAGAGIVLSFVNA